MRRKSKKSSDQGSLLATLRAERKDLATKVAQYMERLTKIDSLIEAYEGKSPTPLQQRVTLQHRAMAKNNPFFGMALPEAAQKQLSTHTAPILARDLWEEMKGLYPTTSKDPGHAVHWALRRREARVGDVMIVGDGKWAMRAWYSEEEQKRIEDSLGPMAGRDRENHIAKTKAASHNMKLRGVMIGRKPKMTPETAAKLRQLIENGLSVAEACEQVGVKPSTFYAHRTKGTFPGLKVLKQKGSAEPDLLSVGAMKGAVN